MNKDGLPNFPLLFERVAHFLYNFKPVEPEQVEAHRMAWEALEIIGKTIYPPGGICDSRPQADPIR